MRRLSKNGEYGGEGISGVVGGSCTPLRNLREGGMLIWVVMDSLELDDITGQCS